MRVILAISGLLCGLAAFGVFAASTTVFGQILAGFLGVIGAVFFGSASIMDGFIYVDSKQRTRDDEIVAQLKSVASQLVFLTEKTDRTNTLLEHLAKTEQWKIKQRQAKETSQ